MESKDYFWFQRIAVPIMNFVFKIYYNFKVIGRENIPSEGRIVICANHFQLTDPFFMCVALTARRPYSAMAKKELFEKGKISAAFIRGLGAFPVDRDAMDVSAIKMAINTLKEEKIFFIFPEGTRTSGKGDARAKPGVGMIALRTNSRVLPVYIPNNKHFRSKFKIIIGEPFDLNYDKSDKSSYQKAADEILEKIYDLGDRYSEY